MGGLRAGTDRGCRRQGHVSLATAAERALDVGIRCPRGPLPRRRQRRPLAARRGPAHRHRGNRRNSCGNPLGLRLPGQSARAGRGQPRPRIRLSGRNRGPERADFRPQTGPARGASAGSRRAGRRSSLRGHARTRHRSRCVGGLGHRRWRLPAAAHDLDTERLGRKGPRRWTSPASSSRWRPSVH